MTAMGGKKALPSYEFDFSTMSDGALPDEFTGSTWAISSGYAVNSPTYVGAELLTDGSLEGTYTDGLCAPLAKTGTPTVQESADAQDGSKAQYFLGNTINQSLNFATISGADKKWYQFSGWAKNLSSTGVDNALLIVGNSFPGQFSRVRAFTSSTYKNYKFVFRTYAANVTLYPVLKQTTAVNSEVVVDNFSVKQLTEADMFATMEYPSQDATVKVHINMDNGVVGAIARLDSASSPLYYLAASVHISANSNGVERAYVSLAKVVNGTVTVLINATVQAALPNDNDYIELKCSGNDVSIYYNGVQVGSTVSVTDAGIISNKRFGFFGAAGGTVKSFLLVSP